MSTLAVRGRVLPADEDIEFWVVDGVIRTEPVDDVNRTVTGGYIVPGLVDAHCHVGLGPSGPVDLEEADRQAQIDRDTGALLLRDCGAPLDTRPLQRDDLPRIIRCGRHIAMPKRYIPHIGEELGDPEQLPDAVAEQARRGDGWVKLVGDWIDRGVGDLAPLWPDDVLAEAISVAHDHGARVTAHVFGEDSLPGLIGAGIDCIEHGTGLTTETIAAMASRGTALVPTLINIENFPSIADNASRYPVYAKHMRELHARVRETVGAAVDAGVRVYAGTDAGGFIRHGRIVDEIVALGEVGLDGAAALGAGSWAAREWLGVPSIEDGAAADLLVVARDPRVDPQTLHEPDLILLRGVSYGATPAAVG